MYIDGKSHEELFDEIELKKLDLDTKVLLNEIHQEHHKKRKQESKKDLSKAIWTLFVVLTLVIILFQFQDKIKPSPMMLIPLVAWIPFFRSFYIVHTNWKHFDPIIDSIED